MTGSEARMEHVESIFTKAQRVVNQVAVPSIFFRAFSIDVTSPRKKGDAVFT